MARTCTAPLLAGPPVSLMFSSISKHTSIGTRCSDGTKVRRPAGLPPRPALLPPHLALQPRHSARRRHRRSTRRRSSRCDGIRHTGRGESQVRSPRQPELSGWPVSVQAVRAASPTWLQQKRLTPMAAARERSLVTRPSLVLVCSDVPSSTIR
jgi:hypothetical protein